MVKKDGMELSRADVRPRRTPTSSAPAALKLGMGPSDRYLGRARSVNNIRLARRRSGVASGLASLSPAVAPGTTRSAPRTWVRRDGFSEEDGWTEVTQPDPDTIEEIAEVGIAL